MKIPRAHILFALLGVAACNSGSTDVSPVASVTVTPVSPTLDVGLTVQFTAEARDASGGPVSGQTIMWATSNGTVASITQDGLATGLTVGTSAITATIGGASGSQPLVVEPSQCVGRVDVNLNAGESTAFDGDTCLLLRTGLAGDRYRVAVARPKITTDESDVSTVTLQINPILVAGLVSAAAATSEAPQAGPAPAERPSYGVVIDDPSIRESLDIWNRTRAFDAQLRQATIDAGLTSKPLLSSGPALASGPALVDPPARLDLFLDLDVTCDASEGLGAVKLIGFNDNLAIYQDSAQADSLALLPAAANRMLLYYNNYVHDLIPQYWGDLPDLDGNQRVILTTTDFLPENAAAAVFNGDLVSTADCATSNEAEIVYFDLGLINRMEDTEPNYFALSVMAHEVKHIVSAYNGWARGQSHPTWIEEGSADISLVLSSRVAWAATGGPAIDVPVTRDHIIETLQANSNQTPPEMYGLVIQLAQIIVNMSNQPNSILVNPSGADESHNFYAGSWNFQRFLGDGYGNAAAAPYADGPFFLELTDSLTPAGLAGFLQATGGSYDELFEEYVVATSVHATGQPQPTRAFTTWNFVSATDLPFVDPVLTPPGDFPWPVTTSPSGNPNAAFTTATFTGPVGPSGVRYHDFVSGGTGAGAQILVTGPSDVRIIVTRLR